MPTLIVEDLLLLMLDDESGEVIGEPTLPYVLSGAVLAELAHHELIRIEPHTGIWRRDTVHVNDDVAAERAPVDALLDDALVVLRERPLEVPDAIDALGEDLQHRVTDRLEHRGFVRREEERVWRIFHTTTWPAVDTKPEDALRAAIRRVLIDGEAPDARTATIIGLIYASGELHRVLRYPDAGVSRREIGDRAKGIAEHGLASKAVGDAVAAAHSAVMAATMAAVAAVIIPTTGAGAS